MTAKLLTLVCAFVFCFGCAKKEPPPPSISEAQQRFEKKCREDFDMHVKTKQVGTTMYIYLPTDKPMFDYEAQKENTQTTDKKEAKFSINFLEGKYEENTFSFEYDFIDRKKSSKEDFGYTSTYTDTYIKQQNNLFVAISDSFFENTLAKGEILPQFMVIIIADIVKGIESRSTFYLQDFKRYMSGDLPYEEYMKRFLPETKGGQSLIGDEIGTHIDYQDIKMSDFLTKQAENRIRFRFQHSDFQPSDDYDTEIVNQIADTLRYYDFVNYKQVNLNNLRLNKKYIFDQEQLKSFGEDKTTQNGIDEKEAGKLIHIIFENGKATFPDEDKTSETITNNATQ